MQEATEARTLTRAQKMVELRSGRPFEQELRRVVEESRAYNSPISHLAGQLDVDFKTARKWLKEYDLSLN